MSTTSKHTLMRLDIDILLLKDLIFSVFIRGGPSRSLNHDLQWSIVLNFVGIVQV
jgi:hypothetical protein